MNRIETALQALQEKEEKAFITYITAGLPDYDKTKAIIKAQEAAVNTYFSGHRLSLPSPDLRELSDRCRGLFLIH